MESFEKLKDLIASVEADVAKTSKNKSACVRVRAKMQEVKDLAQAVREEALSIKKA